MYIILYFPNQQFHAVYVTQVIYQNFMVIIGHGS